MNSMSFGIVYKVTCLVNQKKYIGQTVQPLQQRKKQHEQNLTNDTPYLFARALRKHTEVNFKWKTISEAFCFEDLIEQETFWIEYYKSFGPDGYNMTRGGEGCVGYKHTHLSKEKMSKIHKGKILSQGHKEKIRRAMIGRIYSDETKKKFKERRHSEETKKAISKAHKGRKHTFQAIENMRNGQQNRGPLSEDHKKKISGAMKGRVITQTHRENTRKALTGKVRPEEVKEKLRNIWKDPEFRKKQQEKRRKKLMEHNH